MSIAIIRRPLTMAALDKTLLHTKFRGSLLGSLLGDCLGSPFEGNRMSAGDKITVQKYFDKLEDPTLKAPYRPYTDDTAMMKSVGKFLIDKPEPDFKFLSKLFVKEFFSEPERGYGENVVDVFYKLKNSKFHDVFKPAAEQFNGSGSYGNGGAMRIAPIALYYHNDYDTMLQVAEKTTKITHTHILGVNGALLQCIAIRQALLSNSANGIDAQKFCDELSDKMKDVERSDDEDLNLEIGTPYQDKLTLIKRFLSKKSTDELDDDIIFVLGNGIGAYESVPTAIYCFLRAAQSEIPTVKCNNVFRRTIQYAISLGGDTDTIACMAGAIAGAYLGEEHIHKNIVKQCEFHKEILELADNLFTANGSSSTP